MLLVAKFIFATDKPLNPPGYPSIPAGLFQDTDNSLNFEDRGTYVVHNKVPPGHPLKEFIDALLAKSNINPSGTTFTRVYHPAEARAFESFSKLLRMRSTEEINLALPSEWPTHKPLWKNTKNQDEYRLRKEQRQLVKEIRYRISDMPHIKYFFVWTIINRDVFNSNFSGFIDLTKRDGPLGNGFYGYSKYPEQVGVDEIIMLSLFSGHTIYPILDSAKNNGLGDRIPFLQNSSYVSNHDMHFLCDDNGSYCVVAFDPRQVLPLGFINLDIVLPFCDAGQTPLLFENTERLKPYYPGKMYRTKADSMCTLREVFCVPIYQQILASFQEAKLEEMNLEIRKILFIENQSLANCFAAGIAKLEQESFCESQPPSRTEDTESIDRREIYNDFLSKNRHPSLPLAPNVILIEGWHGTSANAALGILKTGFANVKPVNGCRYFGVGTYTTLSMKYAFLSFSPGCDGVIIGCTSATNEKNIRVIYPRDVPGLEPYIGSKKIVPLPPDNLVTDRAIEGCHIAHVSISNFFSQAHLLPEGEGTFEVVTSPAYVLPRFLIFLQNKDNPSDPSSLTELLEHFTEIPDYHFMVLDMFNIDVSEELLKINIFEEFLSKNALA